MAEWHLGAIKQGKGSGVSNELGKGQWREAGGATLARLQKIVRWNAEAVSMAPPKTKPIM